MLFETCRIGNLVRQIALVLVAVGLLATAPGNVVRAEEPKPAELLIAYDARIVGDDARTRIVIDFDRKPEPTLHYVGKPNRVIIDLGETQFGFQAGALGARGLFSDIRYGRMGEGASRLVLTVARPLKAGFQVMENEPGKGYRLVIDAEMTDEATFADLIKTQRWTGSERVAQGKSDRIGTATHEDDGIFLVAVDAGHGGIDTGATGEDDKVLEKDITLAFAREVADELNRIPGVRAFLVRDKDVFISLSERVMIARQQGAKLFISLHADKLKQKDIRGATVYTASDKASDSFAADLAMRENLSDDVGGVDLSQESTDVTDILIDLTRRETQAFSTELAEHVVKSFEGQIGLINNPHRHAGFRVLQAPDVPSILLEMGFLSNPDDEKLLTDEDWRKKVAERIADAVRRFRDPSVAKDG